MIDLTDEMLAAFADEMREPLPVRERPERIRKGLTAVLAIVERELQESPHHVIDFRAEGWTIKHPLACRPVLFDCPVNRAAEQLDTAPDLLGPFYCDERNGHLILGLGVTQPPPVPTPVHLFGPDAHGQPGYGKFPDSCGWPTEQCIGHAPRGTTAPQLSEGGADRG